MTGGGLLGQRLVLALGLLDGLLDLDLRIGVLVDLATLNSAIRYFHALTNGLAISPAFVFVAAFGGRAPI